MFVCFVGGGLRGFVFWLLVGVGQGLVWVVVGVVSWFVSGISLALENFGVLVCGRLLGACVWGLWGYLGICSGFIVLDGLGVDLGRSRVCGFVFVLTLVVFGVVCVWLRGMLGDLALGLAVCVTVFYALWVLGGLVCWCWCVGVWVRGCVG